MVEVAHQPPARSQTLVNQSSAFCGNCFHYIQNVRVTTPSAANPTCESQRLSVKKFALCASVCILL
jgi:hypothetical protein